MKLVLAGGLAVLMLSAAGLGLAAAGAAAPPADAQATAAPKAADLAPQIEALVTQLGAKEVKDRDEAEKKLLALVQTEEARQLLEKHAKNNDPEVRARVAKVLGSPIWGATVRGLAVRLSLKGGSRPLHAGEVVTFDIHVRNLGTKAVTLVPWWGQLPTVRDADGRLLQLIIPHSGDVVPPIPAPSTRPTVTVEPGGTAHVGSVELKLDKRPGDASEIPHTFVKPGQCTISHTSTFAEGWGSTWWGDLKAADLRVTVEDAAAAPREGAAAR
jgi:hypothetical protein